MNMGEIRDLMQQNVAAPPADEMDLGAVMKAGRRKTVVRRATVLTGTAGLAAVLAGVVVLSNTVTPKSDPGPASPPEHTVVTVDDARDAVRGTDYEVLGNKLMTPDDEEITGIHYSGFTPDGLGYGYREGNGSPVLIDLRTGEVDILPSTKPRFDGAIGRPTYVDADRLVLTGGSSPRGTESVLIFDRSARTWSKTSWSGLPTDGYPVHAAMGTDGRLYFAYGNPAVFGSQEGTPEDDKTLDVWSVSMDDESDVRDEDLTVGALTTVGSSLVWTDAPGTNSPKIHIRALAGGEVTTIDGLAGCEPRLGTSGNDELVLAEFTCQDKAKDRVTVYTVTGDPVVSVVDKDVYAIGLNDTHLEVEAANNTYTFDLDSKKLLMVSDYVGWTSHLLSGRLVVWSSARKGSKVTVAEMK